jgi:cysteine synthase A
MPGPDHRSMTLPSVADAIGWTPLVELSRIARGTGGRILAKLEHLNPGGSKKDRVALQIVADAEAAGTLRPGQTIVELTSGNAGAGLAIVCAVKGYPFIAVMSRGNSPERASMMRGLGAEVVLVDQAAGSSPGHVSGADLALVAAETERIVAARGAFRADQFRLASSARAHELQTGSEMIRQSGGRINAFCDFVGSGGTFAGCARALRAHDPAIRCYVVEPAGAAVLAGEPVTRPGHCIQGGGYALPRESLPLLRDVPIDGCVQVTDDEAADVARRLAREEGIFAGFSAGANVAAALQLLRITCRGATIAVVICDSGLKYVTTGLWAGDGREGG